MECYIEISIQFEQRLLNLHQLSQILLKLMLTSSEAHQKFYGTQTGFVLKFYEVVIRFEIF